MGGGKNPIVIFSKIHISVKSDNLVKRSKKIPVKYGGKIYE